MATPGRAQQCRFMAVVICQMMWPWGEIDQWPWGPECQNPFRDFWASGLSRHARVGTEVRLGKSDGLASHERPHYPVREHQPSGGSVEFPWSPISIYHARRSPCWVVYS